MSAPNRYEDPGVILFGPHWTKDQMRYRRFVRAEFVGETPVVYCETWCKDEHKPQRFSAFWSQTVFDRKNWEKFVDGAVVALDLNRRAKA